MMMNKIRREAYVLDFNRIHIETSCSYVYSY